MNQREQATWEVHEFFTQLGVPLVMSAVAEKIAALRTLDYIEQRGQRGSREKFDRALQKVAEAGQEPSSRYDNLTRTHVLWYHLFC